MVDTYFVLKSTSGYVYRHRCDEEIQQLSLKSVSKDPAVRTEVNLNLSGGNQISSVRGFLSTVISYSRDLSGSLFLSMILMMLKWFITKLSTMITEYLV